MKRSLKDVRGCYVFLIPDRIGRPEKTYLLSVLDGGKRREGGKDKVERFENVTLTFLNERKEIILDELIIGHGNEIETEKERGSVGLVEEFAAGSEHLARFFDRIEHYDAGIRIPDRSDDGSRSSADFSNSGNAALIEFAGEGKAGNGNGSGRDGAVGIGSYGGDIFGFYTAINAVGVALGGRAANVL